MGGSSRIGAAGEISQPLLSSRADVALKETQHGMTLDLRPHAIGKPCALETRNLLKAITPSAGFTGI